jgi:hypothetical protein
MRLSGWSPREICSQAEKSRTKAVALTIEFDVCLMSFVGIRYLDGKIYSADESVWAWRVCRFGIGRMLRFTVISYQADALIKRI